MSWPAEGMLGDITLLSSLRALGCEALPPPPNYLSALTFNSTMIARALFVFHLSASLMRRIQIATLGEADR
jgi:hypothetical protein